MGTEGKGDTSKCGVTCWSLSSLLEGQAGQGPGCRVPVCGPLSSHGLPVCRCVRKHPLGWDVRMGWASTN